MGDLDLLGALQERQVWEGVFNGPSHETGLLLDLMRCPTCGQNTPDSWRWLVKEEPKLGPPGGKITMTDLRRSFGELEAPQSWVSLDWMRCANDKCGELVVRLHEVKLEFHGVIPIQKTEVWVARPRSGANRPVDPAVPERYRHDFSEAADILNRSPRMSAVLSRRILADLLDEYAGLKDWDLDGRVKKFVSDTSRPAQLRQNLEHFRRIGDFGAHTKKDDQDVVISVDPEEAEWLLDLIDRLFELFIVTPNKDAELRARFDKKINAAGDKPIEPPPDTKRK